MRNRYILVLASLVLLSPLSACDPDPEPSDLGQWQLLLDAPDLVVGYGRPSRVLVGSSIETGLHSYRDPEGQWREIPKELRECTAREGSGSIEMQGHVAHVTQEGPGAIVLAAPSQVCAGYSGPGAELVPDQFSLLGVELADPGLFADWVYSVDDYARLWGHPGAAGSFPEALARPLGHVRVSTEGRFELETVLLRSEPEKLVEVRGRRGEFALQLPDPYIDLAPGYAEGATGLVGELELGESFTASLSIADTSFALPEIEAVAVDRIASIELVPVYVPVDPVEDSDREWGPPLGVMAITRDAEGRRIVGAPIEWSMIRGRLAVDHESVEGSDAIVLSDTCREPPRDLEERGATIEARVGDLVETTDLYWIARWSDDNVDPDSPACVGSACDCSTTADPRDSAWATLGLLALGLGLRRRRAR